MSEKNSNSQRQAGVFLFLFFLLGDFRKHLAVSFTLFLIVKFSEDFSFFNL